MGVARCATSQRVYDCEVAKAVPMVAFPEHCAKDSQESHQMPMRERVRSVLDLHSSYRVS